MAGLTRIGSKDQQHQDASTSRLIGVPYHWVMANVMLTVILVVTFQSWQWLLMAPIFHLLLWRIYGPR